MKSSSWNGIKKRKRESTHTHAHPQTSIHRASEEKKMKGEKKVYALIKVDGIHGKQMLTFFSFGVVQTNILSITFSIFSSEPFTFNQHGLSTHTKKSTRKWKRNGWKQIDNKNRNSKWKKVTLTHTISFISQGKEAAAGGVKKCWRDKKVLEISRSNRKLPIEP